MPFGIEFEFDLDPRNRLFYVDPAPATTLHEKRGTRVRRKYNFFARFVPESGGPTNKLIEQLQKQAGVGFTANQIATDPDVALYSRIKMVSGPNITMETQKYNEYNRQRIITTGIQFGDITIAWRDTVDSVALNFWKLYYAHFFKQGNPTNLENPGFPDDAKDRDLFSEWGLDLDNRPTSQNFFKRIELYIMEAGSFSRFDLINPYITNFQHSDFSSDDTSIGEHQMVLAIESIDYIIHEQTLRDPQTGQIREELARIMSTEIQGPFNTPPEGFIRDTIKLFNDIHTEAKGIYNEIRDGDFGALRDRVFGVPEVEFNLFDDGSIGVDAGFSGGYLNSILGTRSII